jgi:hypothetical protein
MSLELRWFFRGSLPESVLDWCLEKKFEKEKTRTDVYLNLHNSDLGVKIRKGDKFEIKYRLFSEEFQSQDNQITGIVEKWKKTSIPLESDAVEPLKEIKAPQIAVKKTRYQKKFAYDPKTKKFEPSEERVKQGLIFEVTNLGATKEKGSAFEYWTLGFDALGDNQEEILEVGVPKFLDDFPLSRPKKPNSFSYPTLIQTI